MVGVRDVDGSFPRINRTGAERIRSYLPNCYFKNNLISLFGKLDFEDEGSAADSCCDGERSDRRLGLI
jgi:hypothetical protein